jgi:hypothetical protein
MEARTFFRSPDLPDDQEEQLEDFRQHLGLLLATVSYVWLSLSMVAVFLAGCCAVGYAAILLLRFLAKIILVVTG